MPKNHFYSRPLRRENLPSSLNVFPLTPFRSVSHQPLTSIPLPQPETIGIQIRHQPRLATVPRDPESQHNGRLANQLVQEQQPGLAIHRQLKRADQTPRRRLDAVKRRGAGGQNRRVDAEHVDLALALVHDHVSRVEVEFEAKGAGARAGKAGENDDEVGRNGVVRSFGDLKGEGFASGVDGIGAQGEGEVFGSGRVVGEDCVRRGGGEDLAADAAIALLGGDKGGKDGEEGDGGAEREMHCSRCKSTSDVVFWVADGPTSQAAFQ